MSRTADSASTLRSVFRFKIRCCDTADGAAVRQRAKRLADDMWETLARESLLPLLKESPHPDLRVFFQGTDLFHLEMLNALYNDFYFAIAAMAFIIFYLLMHTRSLLLSLLGPIIAALAMPLTYIMCAVVAGTIKVSFAAFLALFLTVGFGADVVLVYTDFWRGSAKYFTGTQERLQWTFRHAGRASMATTVTTCLSFLANLFSATRAVRGFRKIEIHFLEFPSFNK